MSTQSPTSSYFYDGETPFKLSPDALLRNNNTNTRITQLLFSGKYADLTVCVQDPADSSKHLIEIPAHRMVLAARSPVFMNMLASGKYRETSESRVFFPLGVTPRIAQQFLYILYSDDYSLVTPKDIPALAELGHMYQVESVIEFIMDTIDFVRSPTNIFELIRIFPRISTFYERLVAYAADHAEEIFLSDAHIAADIDSLYDVLSCENLSCAEALAADAIVRYAATHALKTRDFFKLFSTVRLSGLLTAIHYQQFIEPYFSYVEAKVVMSMIADYIKNHPVATRKKATPAEPTTRRCNLERAAFVSLAQQLCRPVIPAISTRYRPADIDEYYSAHDQQGYESETKSNRPASWLNRVPRLRFARDLTQVGRKFVSPLFAFEPLRRTLAPGKPNIVWGRDFHQMFFIRFPLDLITSLSAGIPRGLLPQDMLAFSVEQKYESKITQYLMDFNPVASPQMLRSNSHAITRAQTLLRYFYEHQCAQTINYKIFEDWLSTEAMKECDTLFQQWSKHTTSSADEHPSRAVRVNGLPQITGNRNCFDYDDDTGVSPADSALLEDSHSKANGELFTTLKMETVMGSKPQTGARPKLRPRAESSNLLEIGSTPESAPRTIARWACPNCEQRQSWTNEQCSSCRQARPEFVLLDWPYPWICFVDGHVNQAVCPVCDQCNLPRAVDSEMQVPSDASGEPYRVWKKTGKKPDPASLEGTPASPEDLAAIAALENGSEDHHTSTTLTAAEEIELKAYLTDPVREVAVRAQLNERGVKVEARQPQPPAFNHRQRILNIVVTSSSSLDVLPQVRQLDWSLTRAYEAMYAGGTALPDADLLEAAREKIHIDDVVPHDDLVELGDEKSERSTLSDPTTAGWSPSLARVSKENLALRQNALHDTSSYVVRPKLAKLLDPTRKLEDARTDAEADAYARMAPYERLNQLTHSVVLPMTNRGEGCQLSPSFVITNVIIRSQAQQPELWEQQQKKLVTGETRAPPKGAYYLDACISMCETKLRDESNNSSFGHDRDSDSHSPLLTSHNMMSYRENGPSAESPKTTGSGSTLQNSYIYPRPGYVGDVTLDLLLAHDVVYVTKPITVQQVPESLKFLLDRYLARGGSVVLDASTLFSNSPFGCPNATLEDQSFEERLRKPGGYPPPHIRLPLNTRLFSNRVNPRAIVVPAVTETTDHFSHMREMGKPQGPSCSNINTWRQFVCRPLQFKLNPKGAIDLMWGTLNSNHVLQGYFHTAEQPAYGTGSGYSHHARNQTTWLAEVPIFRDAAGGIWIGRRPAKSAHSAEVKLAYMPMKMGEPAVKYCLTQLTRTAAVAAYNMLPPSHRPDNMDAFASQYADQWAQVFLNESEDPVSSFGKEETIKRFSEKAIKLESPLKTAVELLDDVRAPPPAPEESKALTPISTTDLSSLLPLAAGSNPQLENIAETLIPASILIARRRRIGTLGMTSIRFVPVGLELGSNTIESRSNRNIDYTSIHKRRVFRALSQSDLLFSLNEMAVERNSILLNMLLSAAAQSTIRRPDDKSLAPGQRSRFVPIDAAIRRRGQLIEDAETARKARLQQWHLDSQ